MTNPNDATQLKHLDSVASATQTCISDLSAAFSVALDDLSDEFDIKLNQVAAGNVFVLGTVSSVVEGAMWLEV